MPGEPFKIPAPVDHLIDTRLEEADREESADEKLQKKNRAKGCVQIGHRAF